MNQNEQDQQREIFVVGEGTPLGSGGDPSAEAVGERENVGELVEQPAKVMLSLIHI